MKNYRKIIVLILSVMMVFTFMPTAAFADDGEGPSDSETNVAEITGFEYDESSGCLYWDTVENAVIYSASVQEAEYNELYYNSAYIQTLVYDGIYMGDIVQAEDNIYPITIRAYDDSNNVIAESIYELVYDPGNVFIKGFDLKTNGNLSWDPVEGAAKYDISLNGEIGSRVDEPFYDHVYLLLDRYINWGNIHDLDDNVFYVEVTALSADEEELAKGRISFEFDYQTAAGTFWFIYDDGNFDLACKGDAADRIVLNLNEEVEHIIDYPVAGEIDIESIIDGYAAQGKLREQNDYEIWAYAYSGETLIDEAHGIKNHYPDVDAPDKGYIRPVIEHITGKLTWEKYSGAAKYKLYCSALGLTPVAEYTELPDEVDLYDLHKDLLNDTEDIPYDSTIAIVAYDENGVIIAEGVWVYYFGAEIIDAVYEPAKIVEVNIDRDIRDGSYYGEDLDDPNDGDRVTFTIPNVGVKSYVYDKDAEAFINENPEEAEDTIPRSDIRMDDWSASPLWAEGGSQNYYYVIFQNFRPDVPCAVELNITTSPVDYIEYNPIPRLLKDASAWPQGGLREGDQVVVHYKNDNVPEIFNYVEEDGAYGFKSQKTGEIIGLDGDPYYTFRNGYDLENRTFYVEYLGKRGINDQSSFVAQSLSLKPDGPTILKTYKDSGEATDAEGNKYQKYSLAKDNYFKTGDVLTVTYNNGKGKTLDVDYSYSEGRGFVLDEEIYSSDSWTDDYSTNYFEVDLSKQEAEHFEAGQEYGVNISFHLYGSNFDYQTIFSEDESYRILIEEPGSEEITRVSFKDTSNLRIADGDQVSLKDLLKWEPEYVNNPTIEWTSTHPEVATVDENGLVTANLQNGQTNGDTQIIAKIGNYSARKNIIVYTKTELTDQNVNLTGNTAFYTGEPRTFGVMCEFKPLTEGIDYEAVFSNNTYIGDASVTITGIGDYKGTVTKTFKIVGRAEDEITHFTVEHEPIGEYTYSGEAFTPAITSVSAVGKGTSEVVPLVEGEDYEVLYENNTNAGTGQIVVCGLNYYMGAKTIPFTINKAPQTITAKAKASTIFVGKSTGITVSGAKEGVTYKSSDTKIATVTTKGVVKGVKSGTVKITVTTPGKNYVKNTKTVTIKVVPASTTSLTAANQATGVKLTWKKITGVTGYKVYRGSTLLKKITSASTVTYTDTKANTNGTKYTFKVVPYISTVDGTAKSVITYRVSRPAISSATNSAAGKATVKWGKNSKATGYEIWYSTSSSFSTKKTATVTKNTTVSKTLSSLTKGKTYYVKIRSYKTVSGKKYYSAWSVVKTVKITK